MDDPNEGFSWMEWLEVIGMMLIWFIICFVLL